MKLPKLGKEPEKKTEKEKIAERREEVLARGRKFKYPLQYAKHHLVIVTIIIAVIAGVAAGVIGYAALYQFNDTSDVVYRLTSVLPVPVAQIDGQDVPYSDYLMIYRSSITPVEQQSGAIGTDDDAQQMRNHYKRSALTEAENYAYAVKLGEEKGITITDEMIDRAFSEHRNVGGTERSTESFLKVLKDNFGLTEREYRRMLELNLMKMEVSRAVDTNATKISTEVEKILKNNDNNFSKVRDELGDKVEYETTGGLVSTLNVDGGRASAAKKLQPGQVSERFVSANGDGYYYVKLTEKTDSEVSYESIKIPFTEFNNMVKALRDGDKVKEYITIAI